MAKARMLHNEISKSLKVDRLSLPARLLFTWLISWADDEGRMKGDPKYVKGMVVPLTNWSLKNIKKYLEDMRTQGLIYYWEEKNEWYIELVKWNEHQQIRKDRLIKSFLPSYKSNDDNQVSTSRQPNDNQETAQANISESNPIELNKSESNEVQPIADKNPYKGNIGSKFHPNSFIPTSDVEYIALETWKRLEPDKPYTFYPTYLSAVKKGLPSYKFGEIASEIEQDPEVRNRGAIFNDKVTRYLEEKRSG